MSTKEEVPDEKKLTEQVRKLEAALLDAQTLLIKQQSAAAAAQANASAIFEELSKTKEHLLITMLNRQQKQLENTSRPDNVKSS